MRVNYLPRELNYTQITARDRRALKMHKDGLKMTFGQIMSGQPTGNLFVTFVAT